MWCSNRRSKSVTDYVECYESFCLKLFILSATTETVFAILQLLNVSILSKTYARVYTVHVFVYVTKVSSLQFNIDRTSIFLLSFPVHTF